MLDNIFATIKTIFLRKQKYYILIEGIFCEGFDKMFSFCSNRFVWFKMNTENPLYTVVIAKM